MIFQRSLEIAWSNFKKCSRNSHRYSVDAMDDSGRYLLISDSMEVNIMYEIALKDLEELEVELLRVGTFYISKQKDQNVSKRISGS